MKTRKILKGILSLGTAAVICASVPVMTAFAAGVTDQEYIDMYVSGTDTNVVRNKPEAIRAIATGLFDHDSSISMNGYNIKLSDMMGVYAAALAVYPELFFVERGIGYSYKNGYVTAITPSYNYTKSQVDTMLTQFYDEADNYLEKVSGKLSKCNDEFSKAVVLHDELVLDSYYNSSNVNNYTFMVNKNGLCENYSRVYAYLLAQCGIYSEIVDSSEMNHEWMKIRLDGSYYNVDATWDDPIPDRPGKVGHDYFLLSDSRIQQSISGGEAHTGYSSLHAATNTKYDSSKFHEYDSKMCKLSKEGTTVYAVNTGGIYAYDYSDDTAAKVLSISNRWYVSGNSGSFWTGTYSGLDQNNGLLYYNTPDAIRTLDPSTGDTATVYTNSKTQKLYGLRIRKNKLYGIFASDPNSTGTETYIKDLPEEKEPDPLLNESVISSEEVTEGESIVITGAASGGEGSYTYQYSYRTYPSGSWTSIGTGSSATFTPQTFGAYQLRVTVSDGSESAEKLFNVTVDEAPLPLVNESTVSATEITVGETVTLTGAASGGQGVYTYSYEYKFANAAEWVSLGSGGSAGFTPDEAGEYQLRVIVNDSATSVEKIFDLTVEEMPELVNESYVNAEYLSLGSGYFMYGQASGGTGDYKYAFYYRKVGGKVWRVVGTEFGDSKAEYFTPSLGDYDVRIVVKDSAGTTEEKTFSFNVQDGKAKTFENLSTISTTGTPSKVGVYLYGGASVSGCRYAYYYKRTNGRVWRTIGKEFSATEAVRFTPSEEGEFNIKVDAINENNEIVSRCFALSVDNNYNNTTGIVSKSSVSTNILPVNSRIVLTGAAEGGTAPYTYGYFYKNAGANTWKQIGDYTSDSTAGVKLRTVGDYIMKIVIKDSAGGMVSENFDVVVE